jgi:hypothetical protein
MDLFTPLFIRFVEKRRRKDMIFVNLLGTIIILLSFVHIVLGIEQSFETLYPLKQLDHTMRVFIKMQRILLPLL